MARFAIRHTADQAEREGNTVVRFSGVSEPFTRGCDRDAQLIGEDEKGIRKVKFITGLNTEYIDSCKWFTEEEKQIVKEKIKDLTPIIEREFGGPSVLNENNVFFWKKDNRVSNIKITNSKVGPLLDLKNPNAALFYLSVLSGAFMDVVAPTKEWANDKHIPHYIALEEDSEFEEEDVIAKSDAHYELKKLREEADGDALFILAWCIQFDTNGYGAYSKSTPKVDLIKYHIEFIEGRIKTKKKRNCPKEFIDYANRWNAPLTRKELFTEAYVKAGEYYNILNGRIKRFTTEDGTELGGTVEEAVKTLSKAKYTADYERLRDAVEAKWNE